MPQWARTLQLNIYLLLINRLYLDALSMRLRAPVATAIDQLNRSRIFPVSLRYSPSVRRWVSPLDHPNFRQPKSRNGSPWRYCCRSFRFTGVCCGSDPSAQILISRTCLLLSFSARWPGQPIEPCAGRSSRRRKMACPSRRSVRIVESMAQVRVPELLAYAGIAFFQCSGAASPPTRIGQCRVIYAGAVTLLSADSPWIPVSAQRYGDFELGRFHGLARPMPGSPRYSRYWLWPPSDCPIRAFLSQAKLLLQPSIVISWAWPSSLSPGFSLRGIWCE